jgi:hypothetical protein
MFRDAFRNAGCLEDGDKGAPVAARAVFVPENKRKALIEQARANARAFGISDDEWSKWRAGHGLARDLLMVLDPARESERVKKRSSRRVRAEREK